ncbi:unnamed protein product [Auanema sp. JU1783]|nr:unnamed protein product [Auanema sp. JU1783]
MFGRTGLQPAPNVPNPRNAGRKKSNPVWEFFTDLRGHGLAGVRCRFCHWVTNDRSPTTMKFHLKRKHDTGPGGLWAICEEKINSQAPANYAPRTKKGDDVLLKALTQTRPFNSFNPFGTGEVLGTDLKNFALTAQDDFLTNLIQQATSMSASPGECQENESGLSLSDALFLNKLNESTMTGPDSSDQISNGASKEEDGSSSSVSGMISNPTDFHLSDGNSVTTLLQIASDNDMAFSFNSRRRAEYCFSSNQRSGRSVVFADVGTEIRVAQKVGDDEINVEHWRKSDWAQFCWAVRGACLHFLKN